MMLAGRLLIPNVLVLVAGVASAGPVSFQLDDVTITGGTLPTSQTYSPPFPIVGFGNLDVVAGTGWLSLPDYSIVIDVDLDGPDVRLDISNWSQGIGSIDAAGNITSTGGGTTACTVLGGLGGFVCRTVQPDVPGWPPRDGPSLMSSAVLDAALQTITVIDNSSPAAGTVTQVYSYTFVPEPGTALLLAGGLVGLVLRRRGRA
ncbi:MAG: PEP-CTERM sorting domain-containing protein [Myxococcota bacterium]|nr:PEP-CTERM sorting domain-containing protein [Myxococcota bacterium]